MTKPKPLLYISQEDIRRTLEDDTVTVTDKELEAIADDLYYELFDNHNFEERYTEALQDILNNKYYE